MVAGAQLRVKYDRLKAKVAEAKQKTAALKEQYEQARGVEYEVEAELENTRKALDAALDAALAEGMPEPELPTAPRERQVHVPVFLRELLAVFPEQGTIALERLREVLGIPNQSTMNTRIQRGLKLGVIARAGRAQYTLTDTGRATRKTRLKAVEA